MAVSSWNERLVTEPKRTESRNDMLTIGVIFMWIGSGLIASDIGLGTWLSAGPMIVVPAVSTIWVCAASLWSLLEPYPEKAFAHVGPTPT